MIRRLIIATGAAVAIIAAAEAVSDVAACSA
jgi:hypothetical protein